MADLLYQNSDNIIRVPVVDEAGEVIPASSFTDAEYVLYNQNGAAYITLRLGEGVEVVADKFVVTIDDSLVGIAPTAGLFHQLTVWNAAGDKLPPVYQNEVILERVFEASPRTEMIVEDGTGLADAQSYVSVEFANEYFARTGFTGWLSMGLVEKENALINASEYADLRWGNSIDGNKLISTQALVFPRRGLYDKEWAIVHGVPLGWKKSVCEYAMQSTKSELIASTPSADAGLDSKKVTVGPITTEKTFSKPSSPSSFAVYPKADAYARNFIKTGQAATLVIRG